MSFPQLPLEDYGNVRARIQSGDVILCSGNYAFSKLIQKATKSCWSHVAFVLRFDDIDRIMVLESIEGSGVRTVALSEYVQNFENTKCGYNGRVALARHRRFKSIAKPAGMKRMAQFAVDRFARPYDEEEIARITARIVGGALGFEKSELPRNDEYICSEYVFECYREIGIDIAYDERGFVAPSDFARDKEMQLLFELKVVPTPPASPFPT